MSSLRLVLKFRSLFRAVGSLFSKSLLFFGFALCFQILYSLSSGLPPVRKIPYSLSSSLRLVLKFSSLFRAVCSLFSISLLSFERFAPCSHIPQSRSSSLRLVVELYLVSVERFAPFVLKFPGLFRAVCTLFSNSLVSFERCAPCSQTLYSLSSGLLPILEFPSLFRAVCALFSHSLISFERFAPCSQIL